MKQIDFWVVGHALSDFVYYVSSDRNEGDSIKIILLYHQRVLDFNLELVKQLNLKKNNSIIVFVGVSFSTIFYFTYFTLATKHFEMTNNLMDLNFFIVISLIYYFVVKDILNYYIKVMVVEKNFNLVDFYCFTFMVVGNFFTYNVFYYHLVTVCHANLVIFI